MVQLRGKIALVTGGASGLGKAIADRLAIEGAIVVITDVSTQCGQATAEEGGFTFLEQDVRNEVRWGEVIGAIEGRFGRLDILVNNAGILGPTDAICPENTRLADWRALFAVNVEGVFLGCRAAIPAMRRTGSGSIINISSIAGLLATPYATAYGCTKAAVRQLTKSVAQHCAEQKLAIRCNSVHPGVVRTTLWERHAEDSARAGDVSLDQVVAEATATIPTGSLTRAEDVAAAVTFLASDDALQITGTKLIVDGGVIGCDSFLAAKATRGEW